MTIYRLKAGVAQAERLDPIEYASEGNHEFSLQRILADNPDLIFGLHHQLSTCLIHTKNR